MAITLHPPQSQYSAHPPLKARGSAKVVGALLRETIQRNQFNLYSDIFRKPRHFHRGPGGWLAWEVTSVGFVHRREVVHVFQEHRRFDYVRQGLSRNSPEQALSYPAHARIAFEYLP